MSDDQNNDHVYRMTSENKIPFAKNWQDRISNLPEPSQNQIYIFLRKRLPRTRPERHSSNREETPLRDFDLMPSRRSDSSQDYKL